jgi:phenylacetate-CoA ligase
MDEQTTLAALNTVLQHCQKAPFYRERFSGEPLRSLAEFQRIPLATKAELRAASPFGLVCLDRSELYQYHETFWTTGPPVSVWLSKQDYLDNAAELRDWGVGFHPDDLVMVRFPYAISSIAHTVTTLAQQCGACVVPAGARSTVSPFPRIVDLLRKLPVTVLACLPLQALLIAETARLLGYDPRSDFPSLRAICTAGELLAPGRRQTVAEAWGVPVFDNYGMTEIGVAVVDCPLQRPHPQTDYFYFEILREDRQTPADPGETGLLVVTTLKRRGTPLVRYLTGDRARLVPGRCACGREMTLEIRGRTEDTVTVGGRRLDLWDIEEIVAALPHRRFWVAAADGDSLRLVVEADASETSLPPELLKNLEERFGIQLSVTVVARGSLYDRDELLAVGLVGKPQYIYTAQEMAEERYLKSVRV